MQYQFGAETGNASTTSNQFEDSKNQKPKTMSSQKPGFPQTTEECTMCRIISYLKGVEQNYQSPIMLPEYY